MNTTTNATSLSKSIGFIKIRTFEFKQIREELVHKKQSRFKRKAPTPLDDSSLTSQNLLTTLNTDVAIELGSLSSGTLPPAWVDIYEEVQEKIKKMNTLHRDIQKLIASKIKMQFGNHEDIDDQIERKNTQATNLLQDCEGDIRKISKMDPTLETANQTLIRKNIERVLATQVQEAAVLFRKQQKGLLDKVKEQNAGVNSDLNVEATPELDMDDENVREMAIMEDLARERDEDINKLVDNINKLNQLFKDMNQLVIEQGTIVDRIDYNLEKSVASTAKAKKELASAHKKMESKCATYFIMILIIGIIICSGILINKLAHK